MFSVWPKTRLLYSPDTVLDMISFMYSIQDAASPLRASTRGDVICVTARVLYLRSLFSFTGTLYRLPTFDRECLVRMTFHVFLLLQPQC